MFLTRKIQLIDSNLQFWKIKEINWICDLTWKRNYILIYFFDKKNQVNGLEFAIWQEKSRIFFRICMFDKKNPVNWLEFAILTQKSRKLIWICDLTRKIKKIYLNFLFWREKSCTFILFSSPNFTNREYFVYLHFKYFFQIKV